MKQKLLMTLTLLCAIVQGAWATETTYENGIFTGFTATAASSCSNTAPYGNIVDGNTNTATNIYPGNPAYVEFYSSGYIVPTGYVIPSGPPHSPAAAPGISNNFNSGD